MKENPFSDLTALALRHEIVSTARFLPLRCFFSDDGISYVPPHFHEDLELIHLLSGELSVTVNQKKFTIYPGDTVLFNTNTIHSTLSERADTTAHVLLLPYEHLRRCLPNPESFPFELPLLSRDKADPIQKEGLQKLSSLLAAACKLCQEQPDFYQAQILSLIYELIYLLCTTFPDAGRAGCPDFCDARLSLPFFQKFPASYDHRIPHLGADGARLHGSYHHGLSDSRDLREKRLCQLCFFCPEIQRGLPDHSLEGPESL